MAITFLHKLANVLTATNALGFKLQRGGEYPPNQGPPHTDLVTRNNIVQASHLLESSTPMSGSGMGLGPLAVPCFPAQSTSPLPFLSMTFFICTIRTMRYDTHSMSWERQPLHLFTSSQTFSISITSSTAISPSTVHGSSCQISPKYSWGNVQTL